MTGWGVPGMHGALHERPPLGSRGSRRKSSRFHRSREAGEDHVLAIRQELRPEMTEFPAARIRVSEFDRVIPPPAGTRHRPTVMPRKNVVSSTPQAPPPHCASQTTSGDPPLRGMLLSFCCAVNPATCRPGRRRAGCRPQFPGSSSARQHRSDAVPDRFRDRAPRQERCVSHRARLPRPDTRAGNSIQREAR